MMITIYIHLNNSHIHPCGLDHNGWDIDCCFYTLLANLGFVKRILNGSFLW